jgi:hypothetical protein
MLHNPDATVETLRLPDGRLCLVVDEMLLEPDSLVQFAATQRNAFRTVDFNFYPGRARLPSCSPYFPPAIRSRCLRNSSID